MKSVFKEIQKFDSLWFFVILAMVSVVNYFIYVQGREAELTSIVVSYGAVVIAGLIFVFFRLQTEIDSFNVKFRFFPFHIHWQEIPWSDITHAEVRTYRPIMEYGGWGLRFGKNGKAYTTKGKTGLQLTLKNGKKILIGTQKQEELKYFLSKNKAGFHHNA